jgi:hypothetical protein
MWYANIGNQLTSINPSLSKLSKLFWGSQDARVPIAVLAAPRSCPARVHTRLPTDGPRVVAPKEATVGGKLGSSKLGTSTAGSDFLPGISRYVYTHTYIYIVKVGAWPFACQVGPLPFVDVSAILYARGPLTPDVVRSDGKAMSLWALRLSLFRCWCSWSFG